MEFDMHVDNLGRVEDVFGLYRFLCTEMELKNHALLESAQEASKAALYSFICLDPDFLLKINAGEAEISNVTSNRGEVLKNELQSRDEDPFPKVTPVFQDQVDYPMPVFDQIKRNFPYSASQFPEIFPRHIFYGGFVGYIGYDTVAPWVNYTPNSEFPDAILAMVTRVLVYNHQTQSLFHIDNTLGDYEAPTQLKDLITKFKETETPSSTPTSLSIPSNPIDLSYFQPNMTPEKYQEMVAETKEHVYAGDIIQAVISRKMTKDIQVDSLTIYEYLRQLNPSPYMYYLNFNGYKIIGSSPEALVTVDRGNCETVPIAGTCHRGNTEAEDQQLERELLMDPKEAAEHVMLVDLARNDLAKISIPGTVDTFEFKQIRKYKDVIHLVSKVRSRTQHCGIDVLKSMFPAGTVSGAPKLRAMEIIRDLEPESRGPYGGVVGYFALNGDCDWAIAIRTLFQHKNTITAQAGAGIVADSDPQHEWMESHNKMASALRAVIFAEEGTS